MKTTISEYQFINEFQDIRPNDFSYDGLKAMYDYFTEYEESCDTEIELDVIAFCCEFTEYENLKELQGVYTDIKDMDDLNDHTMVIPINDESFIIQNF